MFSSSGWQTVCFQTSGQLTGKATWRRKGVCFTSPQRGLNVPCILFFLCSRTKRVRPFASCKAAFSRNYRKANTNCTTLIPPIDPGNKLGALTARIEVAMAEDTGDTAKLAPRSKVMLSIPTKRSRDAPETERLIRMRPNLRTKSSCPCLPGTGKPRVPTD